MSRRERRKSGGGEEGGGMERWLLTYADMITLLLALFIVLFAMATVDPVKYETLRRVLSEQFTGQINTGGSSVLDSGSSVMDPDATAIDTNTSLVTAEQSQQLREQAELEAVYQEVQEIVESEAIEGEEVEVQITERGVVIHLSGDAFFPSGSATLNTNLISRLDGIIAGFSRNHRPLAVEGHTDGVPINTAQYPSNWELSSARANSVAAYLRSAGVAPNDMTGGVIGYADTKPLQKPQYPKQPIAENRRVDIVVLGTGSNRTSDSAQDSNADGGPSADRIDPIPNDIIGDVIGQIR